MTRALSIVTKRPTSQRPMANVSLTMEADEYRRALERLDITQGAAGDLFEVGARTSRRWAGGETRVPKAVALLLRLMLKKRLKLEVPAPFYEGPNRVWTLSAELQE